MRFRLKKVLIWFGLVLFLVVGGGVVWWKLQPDPVEEHKQPETLDVDPAMLEIEEDDE